VPFRPAVRDWFARAFTGPTTPQALGWPVIARGESALILSPTGSGKTLAAFLWCIDRLMFDPVPRARERCRVVYVSPLKALAVDIERNLRTPIAGIASLAAARGDDFRLPQVAVRTGDTPAAERTRFRREPADILITTPESLYLILTSSTRDVLRAVDTVIVDEIHALVPTKRGAHLAVSLERLDALASRPIQRIGLSATQRPLDEVARFLGGAELRRAGEADRSSAGASGGLRAGRTTPGRGSTGHGRGDAHAALHAEIDDGADGTIAHRPVTVVDAGEPKVLELSLEVPVDDMAALDRPRRPRGAAAQEPARPSAWSAIHPRLLELVRGHRSTLMFVNSRRLAERLAAALNDLAGETLVRAHHGSLARDQRVAVEDLLESGTLRGLVATSSLELGIDMGAIDLVVQIEAPPSVASGLQRVGRAGHQAGAASRGVIVPKYRGDLVACAAITRAMRDGRIEATRYPRRPLDVLAQQIVAMTSMDPWHVDDLFARIRCAAPFAALGRQAFEDVLDMLAGRYPSDEFAELRPRITWNRANGIVVAREGARRVAVVNGGTIPDRGLYGVFLAGAGRGQARVGELDEEMVFESRVGETFVLGASTWRIEEIGHDRVLVSPAPGEPGKMPFWKGDGPGRPLELGLAVGALIRTAGSLPAPAAVARLVADHDLDTRAAGHLVGYLREQRAATGAVPDDETVVVERCRDELGDWRVCVLSPLGGQVLAPWAMAVVARVREERDLDVETMWTDEGFVVRFPETDHPPDVHLLLPPPEDAERLVLRQIGSTALFAASFRECAARALLLPRRRPGQRTPLWHQRKRASDLLAVAARFGSFPMLLEAYRECLRDVFDLPGLVSTLRRVADRSVRVITTETTAPSPFAASLLFGYVATYMYDGDAPLAERRAQALSIDQARLRELLGEAELRELLDAGVIEGVERELQHLDGPRRVASADGLHDLLLRVGDLSAEEIAARCAPAGVGEDRATGTGTGTTDPGLEVEGRGAGLQAGRALIDALLRDGRAIRVSIAEGSRLVPVEDATRYRDAIGVALPAGLSESWLAPVPDPAGDLVRRYARTHGPFTVEDVTARLGMGHAAVEQVLRRLVSAGRLLEGAFRPGGAHREWCDAGVLATIRRRSLARLRREVEPVPPRVLGRLVTTWQGTTRRRPGLDALLDAIEQLQGAPLAASLLETEILPARVEDFSPSDLDVLVGAGEVVWTGVGPLGDRDGRVALYLTDHLAHLWRPAAPSRRPPATGGASASPATLVPPGTAMPQASTREPAVLDALRAAGASFFHDVHDAAGGGYPGDTVDALWGLVWRGLVTNDSLQALRAFVRPAARARRPATGRTFRSRRTVPPAGEGRWSLVEARAGQPPSDTEWGAAVAQQLLARYGVVTREVATAEAIAGGFSAVYPVLRTLEERGRVRRGYFAAGVGATQFALPAALDLLRSLRADPENVEVVLLAATDPANPFGALLEWPAPDSDLPAGTRGPTRSVGAHVVLVNGALAAFAGRQGRPLLSFLPEAEPERSLAGRAVANALADLARRGEGTHGGLLVADVNGGPAAAHPLAACLAARGFVQAARGFHLPRPRAPGSTGEGAHLHARRTASSGRALRSSPFGVFRRSDGDEE
jgi:ATP-dependent Lhr-like helicase